jgi:diguanylate cyclase (GGDEF)-like protein
VPVKEEKNIYRTFVISTSLVIAIVLSGVFLDVGIRTRQLINDENLIQARIVFDTILLTRKWNSTYGGVYVEKKAGVKSNPYLEHPDIRTVDGRILTLRNPAIMTREISEYAEQEGMFKFHITSLKPMNPENQADTFETEALQSFGRGEKKEFSRIETINQRRYFRYMAPLFISDECLQCHQKQNYKVGDVRGGISITFDIEDLQRKLRLNTSSIVIFGCTTTVLLLGLIYFFTSSLIKKLAEARMRIEHIAITDELTGSFNRRHVLMRFVEEFEEARRLGKNLGCIMADIDHFKLVNDTYGHLKGDEVLKVVSLRLKQSIRAYDILGRYGGEEFIILLPDANLEQAWNFAERTRMKVRETKIHDIGVTLSLGVTELQEGDQSIDDIIRRADEALYKAKNAGRDRVEWLAEGEPGSG